MPQARYSSHLHLASCLVEEFKTNSHDRYHYGATKTNTLLTGIREDVNEGTKLP